MGGGGLHSWLKMISQKKKEKKKKMANAARPGSRSQGKIGGGGKQERAHCGKETRESRS